MGDPVSERAHYLAVRGEGSGDLFLIQGGRVEHLGFLRAAWRRARPEAPPSDGGRGRIAQLLTRALLLTLAF